MSEDIKDVNEALTNAEEVHNLSVTEKVLIQVTNQNINMLSEEFTNNQETYISMLGKLMLIKLYYLRLAGNLEQNGLPAEHEKTAAGIANEMILQIRSANKNLDDAKANLGASREHAKDAVAKALDIINQAEALVATAQNVITGD